MENIASSAKKDFDPTKFYSALASSMEKTKALLDIVKELGFGSDNEKALAEACRPKAKAPSKDQIRSSIEDTISTLKQQVGDSDRPCLRPFKGINGPGLINPGTDSVADVLLKCTGIIRGIAETAFKFPFDGAMPELSMEAADGYFYMLTLVVDTINHIALDVV
ncbi:MAG: hypothetical protein JXA79_11785 [Deltaproteobacteria bacterium]|nr:hypothetical protein [Deltaproteobacteria bacterium]